MIWGEANGKFHSDLSQKDTRTLKLDPQSLEGDTIYNFTITVIAEESTRTNMTSKRASKALSAAVEVNNQGTTFRGQFALNEDDDYSFYDGSDFHNDYDDELEYDEVINYKDSFWHGSGFNFSGYRNFSSGIDTRGFRAGHQVHFNNSYPDRFERKNISDGISKGQEDHHPSRDFPKGAEIHVESSRNDNLKNNKEKHWQVHSENDTLETTSNSFVENNIQNSTYRGRNHSDQSEDIENGKNRKEFSEDENVNGPSHEPFGNNKANEHGKKKQEGRTPDFGGQTGSSNEGSGSGPSETHNGNSERRKNNFGRKSADSNGSSHQFQTTPGMQQGQQSDLGGSTDGSGAGPSETHSGHFGRRKNSFGKKSTDSNGPSDQFQATPEMQQSQPSGFGGLSESGTEGSGISPSETQSGGFGRGKGTSGRKSTDSNGPSDQFQTATGIQGGQQSSNDQTQSFGNQNQGQTNQAIGKGRGKGSRQGKNKPGGENTESYTGGTSTTMEENLSQTENFSSKDWRSGPSQEISSYQMTLSTTFGGQDSNNLTGSTADQGSATNDQSATSASPSLPSQGTEGSTTLQDALSTRSDNQISTSGSTQDPLSSTFSETPVNSFGAAKASHAPSGFGRESSGQGGFGGSGRGRFTKEAGTGSTITPKSNNFFKNRGKRQVPSQITNYFTGNQTINL